MIYIQFFLNFDYLLIFLFPNLYNCRFNTIIIINYFIHFYLYFIMIFINYHPKNFLIKTIYSKINRSLFTKFDLSLYFILTYLINYHLNH